MIPYFMFYEGPWKCEYLVLKNLEKPWIRSTFVCMNHDSAWLFVLFDSKNLQIEIAMLDRFSPYSAGIDFRRQTLTTNVDPRTVRINIFIMAGNP